MLKSQLLNLSSKRVTIIRNGESAGGKVINVPDSFDDLLSKCSLELDINASRIFLAGGGEVSSTENLRDDDVLYISEEEGFFPSGLTGQIISSEIRRIFSESSPKTELKFYLNGEKRILPIVDPNTNLADYLRDIEGLTGTKVVCGEGGCGACAVMVSYLDPNKGEIVHRAMNSCMLPLPYIHNMSVTTVEGFGSVRDNTVNEVQKRIATTHGVQCGYCTPGFVVGTMTLLANNPEPTVGKVEEALAGNLCRCTGYRPIFDAAKSFAQDYKPSSVGKLVPESNNVKVHVKPPEFPEELMKPENSPLILSDGEFVWFRPTTLEQVLRLCGSDIYLLTSGEKGDDALAHKIATEIVGGNTEIGYKLIYKGVRNHLKVSTAFVKEMKEIVVKEDKLIVGGAVTIRELQEKCEELIMSFPPSRSKSLHAIVDQASVFANYNIRNMATIGGSLYTADPLSDMYPVLMSLDASVVIHSVNKDVRTVSVRDFLVGGRKTILTEDELLVSVEIPFSRPNQRFKTFKVGKRREDSQAICNSGMMMEVNPETLEITDAAISYGAVDNKTILHEKLDNFLIGKNLASSETFRGALDILSDSSFVTNRDMRSLRHDLAQAFFFKFYISLLEEHGVLPPENTLTEYAKPFKRGERLAKQDYEEVCTEVGKPAPHLQAFESTTGEAQYVSDIQLPPDGYHLAMVQSTVAHGRILSIDSSEALKVEGVAGIFGAKDVIGTNMAGTLVKDEEIFASKYVNYYGQAIAVVAAKTVEAAKRAAAMVKVEYEKLPHFQSIPEAIEHSSYMEPDKELEQLEENFATIEDAFDKCDVIVEGDMTTGHQEHFYFETEVAIAYPHPEQVEMYVGCQNLAKAQEAAAGILGISKNRVTAKVLRLGGGFGGRQDRPMFMAAMTALAAWKLKKPVKFHWDRQTDITASGMRHEFLGKYKIGIEKATGIIRALDIHLYNNGGHSTDLTPAVMERALYSADNSYYFPNVRFTGSMMRTNRVSHTAFRGFGVPQAIAILETAIEHVSEVSGVDPDKVRDVNLYKVGDRTPTGWKLDEAEINECMRLLKKKIGNRTEEVEEFNRKNKYRKRGWSLLPIKSGMGLEADFLNQSGCIVEIFTDGTVHLSHGGIEMGQGLHTKLGQVLATELGVPLSKVRVGESSTDKVPNTPPTSAVTGQGNNGLAVLDACRKLNSGLSKVRDELGEDATWEQIVWAAYVKKVPLTAYGHGTLEDYNYNWEKKTGQQSWYLIWTAAYSEVEVDLLTGEWKLIKAELVQDAGSSLNAAIDVGQVEGGYVQGTGLFTMENPIWASDGHLRTRNVSTYKIPSYDDTPLEFNVSLLKRTRNPLGVHSSKATGEAGLQSASSVFFAIRHAIKAAREEAGLTGFFKFEAPATINNIRTALAEVKINPEDLL